MPREIFQIYPVGQPLPGEPGFIGPLLPDEYGGKDTEDDPYKTTRFPKGSLRRKEDLEMRLQADPADGRKKAGLNVRGNSMLPELKPGDQVKTYVDSKITDAKVGDYVTFIADIGKGQESYYTHKVAEVYKNPLGGTELVTRGVNNPRNDRRRVDSSNFIGVTRKHTPSYAGE